MSKNVLGDAPLVTVESEKENEIKIGGYDFQAYVELVKSFHGHVAPGLLIGGFMVDSAQKYLPKNILFDAFCETYNCLPDAIQMLTPCTVGNGWLKILNFGRYALGLYDKYEGKGVRVYLDPQKLELWPEIKTWFKKLKPKKEQNSEMLFHEIKNAASDILSIQEIQVSDYFMVNKAIGTSITCPICGELYPEKHGELCRACQGNAPYRFIKPFTGAEPKKKLVLERVVVEESVSLRAAHDMTQIIPGKFKGPVVKRGQKIKAGDICRLQKMGRQSIYVESKKGVSDEYLHENKVAEAFGRAMAGDGVIVSETVEEGKLDLIAQKEGLLIVDTHRLMLFNMVENVMCASRKGYSVVSRGRKVAGTRAIPLYLHQRRFSQAMSVLEEGPLFNVLPMRKARVGILVTGTEIFRGLVRDEFIPIIMSKITRFECTVVKSYIVPDDRERIKEKIEDMVKSGVDLIVTTAGLSVDPDDVTKQGLVDAGATDLLYGAPILPGAMTLLGMIGDVQIMGIPACGLHFKVTSFDLLLPRLLAGVTITRQKLARISHGALCWGCKTCTYPKCSFGKD